mgnify:CR=1 FL=1
MDASPGRDYWHSESGVALAHPGMDLFVRFGSDARRDLEKMPTWELEKIQRERMEFLQKKFQDIDLLERAMKENQDRLEILAANSERLTTVVQDGLEKVLQDLTKEKEELKQKSEQLLQEKRELEFQLQQMKQRLTKEQENRQKCRGKCPDFKRKSRHLSQGTLTVSESRKKAGAKGNDSNRGTGKRVLEESQIPENGERTRGTAKKRDGDIYQRSHGQL